LADVWKKNLLKEIEAGKVQFALVGNFLSELKSQFGERDNELAKVFECKRVEQEERMMEEFFQEFRRIAKESGYEKRALVEKFKKGMIQEKAHREGKISKKY